MSRIANMMSIMNRKPMLTAMFLMLGSVLLLGWLQARPQDGQEVAAIFPPWLAGDAAFERVAQAGGSIVRLGAVDTIMVVHGDSPDFVQRLYAAGVWMVVDPVAFGGCLLQRI